MKERMLRAISRANDDAEFGIAARMWNADVVFASGDDAVRMTVREGRIAAVNAAHDGGNTAVRVSGPPEGWEKALQPLPPAFYHDLYGASVHHGFRIEGRVEDVGPYYRALSRLIELAGENGAI
jgi:hypothetical protein